MDEELKLAGEIYYEGQETVDIRLLNEKTVESICLLVKKASWRIQK